MELQFKRLMLEKKEVHQRRTLLNNMSIRDEDVHVEIIIFRLVLVLIG